MLNVELSESEEVSRLKCSELRTPTFSLRPSDLASLARLACLVHASQTALHAKDQRQQQSFPIAFLHVYSPSPECPARKSGDARPSQPKRLPRRCRQWRGKPSDPSARAYGRRAEALAKEGYGAFRIPIRMPRAGAWGALLKNLRDIRSTVKTLTRGRHATSGKSA